MHNVCVIFHGLVECYYVLDADIPKDSNTQMTLLSLLLSKTKHCVACCAAFCLLLPLGEAAIIMTEATHLTLPKACSAIVVSRCPQTSFFRPTIPAVSRGISGYFSIKRFLLPEALCA